MHAVIIARTQCQGSALGVNMVQSVANINNNTHFAAVAHMPSTTHPFSQAEQHTFIHIEQYGNSPVSGSPP